MSSIIEKIFLAYYEGILRVRSDIDRRAENVMISDLEKRFGLSDEQREEFENCLFETSYDHERSGFYAGFKLAFALFEEILG